MTQPESGEPGTGLNEVWGILVKTPPERLHSLTYQLGQSAEEEIVNSLCLILLQNAQQALNKLQTLGDHFLAKHLIEKWQKRAGEIIILGDFQEVTSECLMLLARIFNILAEHGLCDCSLRNLAYKRALPQEALICDLEYIRFKEEAKDVCGPELAEFMCTQITNLKLVSGFPSSSCTGNTSATTGYVKDLSESCRPSSLHASSSIPSYPSHLEISIPPTASCHSNQQTQGSSIASTAPSPVVENASELPVQPKSHCNDTSFKFDGQNPHIKIPEQTSVHATKPTSTIPPGDSLPEGAAKEEEQEEEEEIKFYSFVIFHAQQDGDVAECMKEKLEDILKSEGATFSEDFAVPGKSTLRCVEDAINNSAFTLLLLTNNFNSFLEMKSNSALVNSIHKPPKHNTVIPLLPKINAMPREDIPMVLTTLVPLDEKKNFEKKIQKAITPKTLANQKKVWMKEQKLRSLGDRKKRLKFLNQQQQKVNQEQKSVHQLEQERLMLLKEVQTQRVGPDGRPWWQQQPNIHIEHAQYIMIGNNSQMAVDLSKDADNKESETNEF